VATGGDGCGQRRADVGAAASRGRSWETGGRCASATSGRLPAHPPGGATTVAVQSTVMSRRSSPGVCSPPAGGTLPSPTPLLLVSLFLSVMQVHSCFLSWPTLDFFCCYYSRSCLLIWATTTTRAMLLCAARSAAAKPACYLQCCYVLLAVAEP
jgi:hypothetical protein